MVVYAPRRLLGIFIKTVSVTSLPGFDESFLGHKLHKNPAYGFLPHFEYFLTNQERWRRSGDVLDRILAPIPGEQAAAWETWRQFCSAQAEITSIFLVEACFEGAVEELEAVKTANSGSPGSAKSCDICARFRSDDKFYFEVKAQSGQQHGDKHPLYSGPIGFAPQAEDDLRSWLFDEKVSSTTGELMKPYCRQAANKSADILLVMTDIFPERSNNALSLGRVLCPDRQNEFRKFSGSNSGLDVIAVEAGDETCKKMCGLREIWLFNSSRLTEMLALHARNTVPILFGNA